MKVYKTKSVKLSGTDFREVNQKRLVCISKLRKKQKDDLMCGRLTLRNQKYF